MTLPNFFIIGAAKSGTSSLYMYLKQHPEIYMSSVKEPHYFSFNSESKNTRGPGDSIHLSITDFHEYEMLFDEANDEIAIGEASSSYLYRKEAPKRIYDLIPDAKIIAILRHPADRAFSAYMHLVRDQREDSKNFNEALTKEVKRIKSNWDPIWHYTSVGFYHQQLVRYYELFPEENIKVFLYEELVNDPQRLLKNIFQFLNVNPTISPDFSVRFNVSGEQKSAFMQKLISLIFNTPNPIRWLSRKLLPGQWRWKATNWIRERNLKRKQLSPQQRAHLTKIFREDIEKLQTLISKDLSHWLE